MKSLFNFSTLNVELIFSTKSLNIQLIRPDKANKINMTMLEELDQILSWCSKHIEVESIYIEGHGSILSQGLDLDEFNSLDSQKAAAMLARFQKIVFGLMHLPQTVVIDAGKQCQNIAAELLVGADIVFANKECEITFNHLHIGLVPQSGGISLLQRVTSPAMARNWLLTGLPVSAHNLLSSGFVYEFYDDENDKMQLLNAIHKQSHLARIQTKGALLECKRDYLEAAINIELSYGQPSNKAEDWKKSSFTNPKEVFKGYQREKASSAN